MNPLAVVRTTTGSHFLFCAMKETRDTMNTVIKLQFHKIGRIISIHKFLSLLLTTMIAISIYGEDFDYFRNHYIICVDQSGSFIRNTTENTQLYKAIVSQFEGQHDISMLDQAHSQVDNNMTFDEQLDEISLFAFGINYSGLQACRTESQNGQLSPNEISNNIGKRLVGHKRSSFSKSSKNLHDFLESELNSLFNGYDPLSMNFGGGVTLSHYVFPTVLEYLDSSRPAIKYFFIFVSDFQAGQTSQSDAGDRLILERDVTSYNQHVSQAFIRKFNDYKQEYICLPWIELHPKATAVSSNNMQSAVYGCEIAVRSLAQLQAYVASGMKVRQTGLGSSSFKFDPVRISFKHHPGVHVDRIVMQITDPSGTIKYQGDVQSFTRDSLSGTYSIPSLTAKLDGGATKDDMLNIDYLFYVNIKTLDGRPTIPYVYDAKCEYKVTQNDIVFYSTGQKIFWSILAVLVALGLAWFTLWLWSRRGRKERMSLDLRISPVSNMRFQQVEEHENGEIVVINKDCWYLDENYSEQKIWVSGIINRNPLPFSRKYTLKAKYKVEDIDQDYDFTFRPDGQDGGGNNLREGVWYDLSCGADGIFNGFNVITYVDEGKTPIFQNAQHILKMRVSIQYALYDNKGKEIKGTKSVEYKDYEFICKPKSGNLSLWMAFDPGTSGCCVAYGYSGQPDKPEIEMAKCDMTALGKSVQSPIFPSKVSFPKDSRFFDNAVTVNQLEEDRDFYFGVESEQRRFNRFESIKKLLGYTGQYTVKADKKERLISGADLAYLIVRGLCNHFERFIREDRNVNLQTRNLFFSGSQGAFTPSRAIVAIPNNYTLVKVRAMVNSIERTGLFKEVHYIYESEGALMWYLRHNWTVDKLKEISGRTIIVFDMGGATINATAFKVCFLPEKDKRGHFTIPKRSITLSTISKVGYNVGGDDIDYAIIQILYNLPAVSDALQMTEKQKLEDQKKHKADLLEFARKVKLDWIDKKAGNAKEGNITSEITSFYAAVRTLFEDKMRHKNLPTNHGERDEKYLNNERLETMNKYVFNAVRDAISDLLASVPEGDVELVLSGRSTLYPGIEDIVVKVIEDNRNYVGRSGVFNKPDTDDLDADAVKTAVVQGACWYAMFSDFFIIQHNIVTSTFGFLDNTPTTFHPVVKKNELFEGLEQQCTREETPDWGSLDRVEFIQMLGSDWDNIYHNDIKHKMNRLVYIPQDRITQKIRKIAVSVDALNNFSYKIYFVGSSTPDLTGNIRAAEADIASDNSDAYIFAAHREEVYSASLETQSATKRM